MFNIIFSGAKGFLNLIKELFWRRRKIAFLIYLGLFINIVCWGIFYWLFKIEQSLVILHYNVFLGIDSVINIELGKDFLQMYLAPLGGTFFWLFNLFLVFIFGTFSDFWKEQAKPLEILQIKNNQCRSPDPGILGVYIILMGDVFLQLSILLHAIAIFFVNR